MESYDTLSEAMTALRKQGYSQDFNLKGNRIECSTGKYKMLHHEFVIDKSFRFDEDENPGDQAVLYAISSEVHHIKGLLINGVGIYSDSVANELLEKLK
jgi:hypothetical protein